MSDDEDVRRRRALYRASHRGTKEMDIVLGRYADARLQTMSGDKLARFERLLNLPDPQLENWIFGAIEIETLEFADLIDDVRQMHGLSAADAGAK
jgi:antitoxin CptB